MKGVKSEVWEKLCVMWTSLSPSPRPSPSGRGSPALRLSNMTGAPDLPTRCRGFSLSPRERAGVRGNGTPDHLRLAICRIPLLFILAFYGPASLAASATNAAPEGWQTLSPRDELRPQFSFNPKGGPSGQGCFVIRTGPLEGLDGHWAKTFPVKGGQYYQFHALRQVEHVP